MCSEDRSRQPEVICLQRLAHGEDAWREFWQIFGWIIADEVRKFGKDDHELRMDSFQELVLKLLENDCRIIKKHRSQSKPGEFGAYLRKMARHLLIDKWRQLQRQRKLEAELAFMQAHMSHTSSDTQESYGIGFLGSKAERLLLLVTKGSQDGIPFQILYRRFIEGQSVNDIASQLCMQPNAVTKQIGYYRRKLLTQYRKELEELKDEG